MSAVICPFLKAVLIIATILAWLPAICLVVTVGVAAATGCRVDEGSVHPCIVAGHDIGDALYAGLMMVWAIVLAFPFMIGTVVLWVFFLRWRPARSVS